jgi:hypothetical protein
MSVLRYLAMSASHLARVPASSIMSRASILSRIPRVIEYLLAYVLCVSPAYAFDGFWQPADIALSPGARATFNWDVTTNGDQPAIDTRACRVVSITSEVTGGGSVSLYSVLTALTSTGAGTLLGTVSVTSRLPQDIDTGPYFLRPVVTVGSSGTITARCTGFAQRGTGGGGVVFAPLRYMGNAITPGMTGFCIPVSPIAAPSACAMGQLQNTEIPLQTIVSRTPVFLGAVCVFTGLPGGTWEAGDYIRFAGQWRRSDLSVGVSTTAYAEFLSSGVAPVNGQLVEVFANESSPYSGSQSFRMVILATNDTGVAWTGGTIICTAKVRA